MKVAIIDLDSVMFTILQGNKVLGNNGEPIKEDGKFVYTEKSERELLDSADSIMTKILTDTEAKEYIAFIKGYKTTDTRKSANPDYKANRPTQSPKMWNFIKEYLMSKWRVTQCNNIEVDDAVRLTYNYYSKFMGLDCFTVAIDKDIINLEGKAYNWRKEEWITTTAEQANQYFWKSMITGDTIDCIKGIPGKGEKYVEKLFLLNAGKLSLRDLVFNEYIAYFGEYRGIEEFFKNYKCLKVLEELEGFVYPNSVKFELQEKVVEKIEDKEF